MYIYVKLSDNKISYFNEADLKRINNFIGSMNILIKPVNYKVLHIFAICVQILTNQAILHYSIC